MNRAVCAAGLSGCPTSQCSHEKTPYKCIHCRWPMVRNLENGLVFCSHPNTEICDYDIPGSMYKSVKK